MTPMRFVSHAAAKRSALPGAKAAADASPAALPRPTGGRRKHGGTNGRSSARRPERRTACGSSAAAGQRSSRILTNTHARSHAGTQTGDQASRGDPATSEKRAARMHACRCAAPTGGGFFALHRRRSMEHPNRVRRTGERTRSPGPGTAAAARTHSPGRTYSRADACGSPSPCPPRPRPTSVRRSMPPA